MKKNFKTHLLAVIIAGILSFGFYLVFTDQGSSDLSADILGIQRGDAVTADISIQQLQDHIVFSANRPMLDMRTLHILVMYDDESIESNELRIESEYGTTQTFGENQGVVVVTTDSGVNQNDVLFVLYGIQQDKDLIIADISVTFENGDSERVLFSQPT